MPWAGNEIHHFKDHGNEARIFTGRIVAAVLIVFSLFFVLLARFYSLQVSHYQDYITQSDKNRIQIRPVPPNRGLIFDRNGELLADNRPSFSLEIVVERAGKLDVLLENLSGLIEITDAQIDDFKKAIRSRRPHAPVPLRYNLNEEEIATIAVNEFRLNGVEVRARLSRYYPQEDLFAHTIGYVGRISANEKNAFTEAEDKAYRGTHSIGKIGLERFYEDVLLGAVGSESGETNAHGRWLRALERIDPQPGQDLELFMDSRLQKIARESLGENRGAIVAIEVDSGGVLAMVSTPAYDPNLFVNGISHKDYDALNKSFDLPLFNRTIQGQYPPGSTIKPVYGLAGLEYRLVSGSHSIVDPGFYQLENDERLYREWKKGGHGNSVNLRQAIVESCDVYFYDLAFNMGVDRMHEFGLHFGFGDETGLDIPSERPGLWPSRAWKRGMHGLPWFPGDSLNMSIGQGYVLATPLQLAVMTATLASRGTLIKPRLVKSVGGVETEMEILGQYEGEQQNWDYIISSMEGVVHSLRGTAYMRAGRNIDYRMAGKTGTAQVVGIAQDEEYDSEKLAERNRDHGLFVAFAPAENPQIAVAAIVENGESGAATPVVRKVIDSWLALANQTNEQANEQ